MSDFSARLATAADEGQFVALAQAYMTEYLPDVTFDEERARWTFAGLARQAPAIVLLHEADDMIGFALVRAVPMPFTFRRALEMECLFVREDKRCFAAEAMVLQVLHDSIPRAMPAETRLAILWSDHASDLCNRLGAQGYVVAGAYMRFTGNAEASLSAAANATSLHETERPPVLHS